MGTNQRVSEEVEGVLRMRRAYQSETRNLSSAASTVKRRARDKSNCQIEPCSMEPTNILSITIVKLYFMMT